VVTDPTGKKTEGYGKKEFIVRQEEEGRCKET
jgi:hypothetical protein